MFETSTQVQAKGGACVLVTTTPHGSDCQLVSSRRVRGKDTGGARCRGSLPPGLGREKLKRGLPVLQMMYELPGQLWAVGGCDPSVGLRERDSPEQMN